MLIGPRAFKTFCVYWLSHRNILAKYLVLSSVFFAKHLGLMGNPFGNRLVFVWSLWVFQERLNAKKLKSHIGRSCYGIRQVGVYIRSSTYKIDYVKYSHIKCDACHARRFPTQQILDKKDTF